jgi:hypothetical protein
MPMSRTPDDQMNLRFAWAVLMLGYNQHDVAAIFGVNGGRVAEAVQAVRLAVSDPVRFTKLVEAQGQAKLPIEDNSPPALTAPMAGR